MANPHRGEVGFEVDGKSWVLKLGTTAMCEIETLTGKTITEVGRLLADEQTASMTLMRAVFWGGLQDRHEGITIRDASVLMDAVGMERVGSLIGQAFEAAFPATKADPEAKAGSARPPRATAA